MAWRGSLKKAGWAARVLAEGAALFIFLRLFLALGGGQPGSDARMLRPVPDAAEYAWAAMAMAHNRSPLMPIVNELHPSRYSILHPALMSLWVRARGGALESLFSWPPAALLIGVIFIYLVMIRARVLWVFRLAAIFLIALSPVFFTISRGIMQESTLFLLMGTSVWLWSESANASARSSPNERFGLVPAQRRAVLAAFGFLAGASSAALACIRPTLAPLGIFLFGASYFLPRDRGRHALAFLLGGACCVLGAGGIAALLTGRFRLLGYSHWIPGFGQEAFQWSLAFKAPSKILDSDPRWLQITQDLLGIRSKVSAAGFAPMLLLATGMTLGRLPARWLALRKSFAAPADGVRWILIPVLLLFVLSQAVLHSFYMHVENRFFLPSHMAFVLGGILGIQRMGEAFWAGGRIPRRILVSMAAAVVYLPLSQASETAESLAPSGAERHRMRGALAMLASHRLNHSRITRLSGPIFIYGIPVLNARMLLNLEDSPQIIAPIIWRNDLYWDGHVTQFMWYRVGPPSGLIEDPFIWDQRPDETYLYDPRTRRLNKPFIERILDEYGQAELYFPREYEKELAPALKAIEEGGYTLLDVTPIYGWQICVLAPGLS